jgi:hypothetical protein
MLIKTCISNQLAAEHVYIRLEIDELEFSWVSVDPLRPTRFLTETTIDQKGVLELWQTTVCVKNTCFCA